MTNIEDGFNSDHIPQFLEHYEPVLFDKVNNEKGLIPRTMYPIRAQTLLAIVAPPLLQHKLESREDFLVYNPQKEKSTNKCTELLDGFVTDKEESILELVMPAPIKARDPFYGSGKKIGVRLSFEVKRHAVMTILDEEDQNREEGSP